MQEISLAGAYRVGERCAFAESGYQVMRNIASAVRYAETNELPDWRAIFAYVPAFSPGTRGAIEAIRARLQPDQARRVLHLDYEDLTRRLIASPDAMAHALGLHVEARLKAARP